MADTEKKREEIQYTPEELAEIQRIIDVTGSLDEAPASIPEPAVQPAAAPPKPAAPQQPSAPMPEYDFTDDSEPDIDDIPLAGFDDADFPAAEETFPEEIDEPDEEEIPNTEEIDEPEQAEDEFPDITDNIQDTEPAKKLNSMDELNELTADEPESLDDDEIPKDDGFIGGEPNDDDYSELPEAPEIPDDTDDTGGIDIDDLPSPDDPFSDDELELPDMEPDILEETDDFKLPDMDDDLDGIPDSGLASEIDGMDDDLSGMDEGGTSIPDAPDDELDDDSGLPDVDVDDYPQEEMDDDFPIEPLDDDDDDSPAPSSAGEDAGAERVDLSEKDLKKLKKAMALFNPGLRGAITNAIVNDILSPEDTQSLVELIITGQSEAQVKDFLEELLDINIPDMPETGATGHRVLHSRPEYMREGRERQKKRLKALAFTAAAVFIAFIITILSYQYIYKPVMAKKKINEGVELIVRPGDYETKPADYRAAEALAREVEENYIEKYVYGYNRYAGAYLKKKEYQRSYDKLNTAYALEPQNIETLLSLGGFYAKVPAAFYNTVRNRIGKNYYPPDDDKDRGMAQLDLAINFYKRVLTLDPKEVRALQGIGNAYFMQGQFLKAKNFYLDILKVDPNSVVGYSGLLNLYIERDSYDLAATTHADLRYRNILKNLPKPLLAKLAAYYLSKNKTDSFNVRVDFGVQSPSLKDANDNTLPAVRDLLALLNSIDSSYPPLMLLMAKMNIFENNIKAADRYLDRALAIAPGYFDALHLKGKICYDTNQPVKAYQYLTKAVGSYANQPDFTEDDFYKGTENFGESYAILGNVFYYFFDKVRYRYGDLDDEVLDEELEKMANYSIAKEKYELAIKEDFASSEIYYNLGRINYLNKQYSPALEQWLHLYDDFVRNPELMLALGNAFYHLGQYDASKGEFLKLINVLEHEAEGIRVVDKGNFNQIKLFKTLAVAYNNIGAVYQLKNDESKSGISYWKAIDYAARLGIENEFARVNNARYFNNRSNAEPILDESVPYSIKYYTDDMRGHPWSK